MPHSISVADSITALPETLQAPSYMKRSGEQQWSTRRMRVAHKILSRDVGVVCVQEALIRQLHDLQELLGDEWAWEGAGRDDGKEAGELGAVFFRKTHFRVQPVDHFCLSETPFAPSQHKSAANIRICTAIRLLLNPDIPDEQQFVVLNTHLDHQSDLARRFGASLMLHRARHEAAKFGPVLVFGDFDKHAVSSSLMECVALVRCSPPTGSDSGAYAIMTRQRAPAATFVQTGTTIKCQCGNAPRARPELDMLNEESVSECSVAYKDECMPPVLSHNQATPTRVSSNEDDEQPATCIPVRMRRRSKRALIRAPR